MKPPRIAFGNYNLLLEITTLLLTTVILFVGGWFTLN